MALRSTFLLGPIEIELSTLVDAVEFVNEHDLQGAWYAENKGSGQPCGCMDFIRVTFAWQPLLELRDRVYRLLEIKKPRAQTDDGQSRSYGHELIDILLSVRSRLSTDPRDKIYAILSLVNEWAGWLPIKADYSKSKGTVFMKLVAQMVSCGFDAKTLLLAQGAKVEPQSETCLPTWVPDWRNNGTGYGKHLFTISDAVHHENIPRVCGPTLALRGRLATSVREISDPCSPMHGGQGGYGSLSKDAREALYSFVDSLQSWRDFACMQNSLSLQGVLERHASPANEPVAEAQWSSFDSLMTDLQRSEYTVDFMPKITEFFSVFLECRNDLQRMGDDEMRFLRTLLHNTYPLRLQLPENQAEALCILRIAPVLLTSCVDPDRLMTRLNSTNLNKMVETLDMLETFRSRLFWTDSGHLGVGRDALEGDEIYFLEGVDAPFVLRPLISEEEQTACHEYVGVCYVDGLEKAEGEVETVCLR